MHQLSRRGFACLLLAASAASGIATAQTTEPYPTRPVRIIVPFPPGQASDTFARVLAEKLVARWPQAVVVENRPGGGGVLAAEAVMRSPTHGYKLLWGGTGITVLPAVAPRPLPYNVARDLAAVARVADIPMMFFEAPSSGICSLGDLPARARSKPGKLVYGSGGPGSLQQLTGELLAMQAGLQLSHVPYRGSGPAMADLLAGNIPLMVDSSASALLQIHAGRVVALGVASDHCSPLMPEIPTVAEVGVAGVVAMGWNGLYAPAATPPAQVERLNAEANAILREPAVASRLAELGAEATSGSREAFQAFTLAELAKWREVAQAAKVTLD